MKKFPCGRKLAVFVLFVLAASCNRSDNLISDKEVAGPTFDEIIAIIMNGEPSHVEQARLDLVSPVIWEQVSEYFRENPGITPYVNSGPGQSQGLTLTVSCSWDGVTERDLQITSDHDYKFQGHNAAYFIVDGPANCYYKYVKPGWLECVESHGCVWDWDLLCADQGCAWWWNGQKYVKTVVLLIPTTWWWYYWPWPASYRTSAFLIAWNDVTSPGCCF